MTNSNPLNSGDGTRPTTDGGVDNIGAGEKFTTKKNRAGEPVAGPAPPERMSAERADAESSKADDSAPFGLRPDAEPESNTEAPPRP